jgi:hypothetical protein
MIAPIFTALILVTLALSTLAQVRSGITGGRFRRLHAWTGQYPLFTAGIAFVFGLLFGHLF